MSKHVFQHVAVCWDSDLSLSSFSVHVQRVGHSVLYSARAWHMNHDITGWEGIR